MDVRAEVETLPEAGRVLVPLCDTLFNIGPAVLKKINDIQCRTRITSQIRIKLRDWAIWQARAGCYSKAALSSTDSKTL